MPCLGGVSVHELMCRAGKTGTLKSLHLFMDKASHAHAVRCDAGQLEITDAVTTQGKPYKLLNLPYFLAGKIFEYLERAR